MGATEASAWLDLIIAKSAELRAAGVTTVTVGACSVHLAPPAPVAPPPGPMPTKPPPPNYDVDPLSDPALGVADAGYDLSGVANLLKEISAD